MSGADALDSSAQDSIFSICADCRRSLWTSWSYFRVMGSDKAEDLCLSCGRLRIERLTGIVLVKGPPRPRDR